MRTFVTFEDLPYIVHFNSSQLDCDDLIKHQYLPTLPSVLAEFGKFGTLMLTVCCMLTLLVIAIFVEESIILFRRWPLRSYCHTMAILAVFPISCICFFLTMLIPRSNDLNTTVATLYQPLSLVLFFKLIVSYMGREKNLKESLMGKQIPTKGPPLYWFCVCFPSCKMNKKLYYLMKACIYQLFMAPCFLYFVMGVCSKTGVYQPGQVT
ncbi:hypothetical protein TYRP_020900 [Tyrophagus putrescentiae]|nr:hypothetical protein TYRP_020900 [Tyrophagus putrescentiae]